MWGLFGQFLAVSHPGSRYVVNRGEKIVKEKNHQLVG